MTPNSTCRVAQLARQMLPVVVLCTATSSALAQETGARYEFTRMLAHWARYGDDDFLAFVDESQPDLVQHGFYGAHFWSLVHTPQYGGYPAHFPVQGLDECGRWLEERNRQLKRRGVKVIGHFNVEFLVGDPDGDKGPRGFFHFYKNLWNEDELGPRPVDDPKLLLERGADGQPISNNNYSIGGMREYWACLRNPYWQAVLKVWVKRAVERGLDGLIANYFYRHNCLCEHCQTDFRRHLAEHFTAEQLRQQFAIDSLGNHRFDELVFWHAPKDSTPLRREMLRWSQISNKRVFDEVFIKYGRSLKKDFLVAQWNHLGDFQQISGDERCLLPGDVWGRDEDYLWYSLGGSAFYTDLEKRFLGEGTLQARYIRGAFDDKSFTLGKYENTRIRAAIAELAANGGAPMGFYTRYHDPEARREIVRYYQFLKRFESLYRGNRSYAEAVLLFPRKAIHAGDLQPLNVFRDKGRALLDAHVLFDVAPDDLATADRLSAYRLVRTPTKDANDANQADTLKGLSRFEAPYTVRVSASRPRRGDEITLHLVNYNRKEPPRGRDGRPSAGRGIVDEQPIAAEAVSVDLVAPEGKRVVGVETMTPESPDPEAVIFRQEAGRVTFRLPEFLVYRIARIRTQPMQ